MHTLSRKELGLLFPIIISEPNPLWPAFFLGEKKKLLELLGPTLAIRIEHVGSTAVPNLPAKPTIDILVEIPKKKDIEAQIIKIMTSNGYDHMHEQKNHIMVVKGYTPEGIKGQVYHIHMGSRDCRDLADMLLFREHLKSNGSIARSYAKLKQRLAVLYTHDREAYTEAKTAFIKQALGTIPL